MDNGKKISPVGESWSEYRKKHYTAEEIAKNNLMVKLVGEVVKTRKEKNCYNTCFMVENAGKYKGDFTVYGNEKVIRTLRTILR